MLSFSRSRDAGVALVVDMSILISGPRQ